MKKKTILYNKKLLVLGTGILISLFALRYLGLKKVGINEVNTSNTSPINTTIIATLLIDAPQGLKGRYLLLDSTGNVTILNTDKNIDSLEGQLIKVEGQIYPSGESSTYPYINAINISVNN